MTNLLPVKKCFVRKHSLWEAPSPLVRDTATGWRTGRLDRVLDGDFDLIARTRQTAARS